MDSLSCSGKMQDERKYKRKEVCELAAMEILKVRPNCTNIIACYLDYFLKVIINHIFE